MRKWINRVGLAGLAAGVLVIGWRAVHSFVTFGARSKAAEARTNLKKLCADPTVKLEGFMRYTYSFTDAGRIIASGNIDADPALDVWSVGTSPPCEPRHDVEDVE